jgi:PAS domain S-box-containing protein
VGRFASVFADITERTQAENALRRMVKDLGETQRIAHIGSWHLDLASNQVVWTEELYKMYGFDPTLPVPPYTEHMKLFTPESWERLSSALAHTRETGVPYTLELQTVRKDGSSGWLWARGEAEVDLAGKTIGLWGAAQDITERKQAHQAVLEALTRVDRLAQHVPGMLYQYHLRPDGTSHFPYASAGIKEIYGVLPEQVSQDAEAVFKLGHPDDFQQVIESIQASARTLNDWHKEYRVNLPDGRTIWVEGEASPEAAPDGGVLGMATFGISPNARKRRRFCMNNWTNCTAGSRRCLGARAASFRSSRRSTNC